MFKVLVLSEMDFSVQCGCPCALLSCLTVLSSRAAECALMLPLSFQGLGTEKPSSHALQRGEVVAISGISTVGKPTFPGSPRSPSLGLESEFKLWETWILGTAGPQLGVT